MGKRPDQWLLERIAKIRRLGDGGIGDEGTPTFSIVNQVLEYDEQNIQRRTGRPPIGPEDLKKRDEARQTALDEAFRQYDRRRRPKDWRPPITAIRDAAAGILEKHIEAGKIPPEWATSVGTFRNAGMYPSDWPKRD